LKKTSFQDRISELIVSGGDPLRGLLPDPDGVSKRASRIRNPLAHGSAAKASSRQIFDATDELLLILEFHFLVDAGFPLDQAAERLRLGSRSHSGLWLRLREDEAAEDGGATRDGPGVVPPR
jgi:hypothetical protein